jgi:Carboxypeptidase regulatory-like domain/TonB dependent receptor
MAEPPSLNIGCYRVTKCFYSLPQLHPKLAPTTNLLSWCQASHKRPSQQCVSTGLLSMLMAGMLVILIETTGLAQTGSVRGLVTDQHQRAVQGAVVTIETSVRRQTLSDEKGEFNLTYLPVGTYRLNISCLGFQPVQLDEVTVEQQKTVFFTVVLPEGSRDLTTVLVRPSKPLDNLMSVNTMSSSELERFPGGNRDPSRAVQSLPGIIPTGAYRNDIIVRGGAPSENTYFLDGIELKTINHLATQGAAGGLVGILNVDFIKELTYRSSALPASRANALSAVLDFKQKTGNPDHLRHSFTAGLNDLFYTLDGPLGNRLTVLASVRNSHLKPLFRALNLALLPTYLDAQIKLDYRLSKSSTLAFVGINSSDNFVLNRTVNDQVTDPDERSRNEYILQKTPENKQSTYTLGLHLTSLINESVLHVILSRNFLDYQALRTDSDPSKPPLLDYRSSETENRLRVEWEGKGGFNGGIGIEDVLYRNNSRGYLSINAGVVNVQLRSALRYQRVFAFVGLNRSWFNKRLILELASRVDAVNYTASTRDLLRHFSPRIAVSVQASQSLHINASWGRYYQLPANTLLGFTDSTGAYVNQANEIGFIQATHMVTGLEFRNSANLRVTVEGFFKQYANYPVSLWNETSLANFGAAFGAVGNEPVVSKSIGKAYGLEIYAHQKIHRNFYGVAAYTWQRSFFTNGSGPFVSSTWDVRHFSSLLLGKTMKHNISISFRQFLVGGVPYTPYNLDASAYKTVWKTSGDPILDYTRLNTFRTSINHQMDLRIEKSVYIRSKIRVKFYVDVQNVYNHKKEEPPILILKRDSAGQPIEDPTDSSKYMIQLVRNYSGSTIPFVGVVIQL